MGILANKALGSRASGFISQYFQYFQVKSVIPSDTGKNQIKYLHFYVLKDIYFVLKSNIFFGFFHYFSYQGALGVLGYGLGQKQPRLVILAT